MTQVILMLSQLILLPIQIHLWGQVDTARWYSALALATVTYFVDCGLRTAGHAELIGATADPSGAPSERLRFGQIWNWIRLLVVASTATLICIDFVVNVFWSSGGYSLWHSCLILACSCETVLVIRIMYLDSLGRYRGAEASYFFFAALRLALSIPALLLFHWKEPGLAGIYLATAGLALLAQGRWLCQTAPLLRLDRHFFALSWKVLALSRHTVAEPLANWTRLSLPVLLLGHLAAPMAVTTYVALRAVFGAGRTTIQQLARVASVEVLKARTQQRSKHAEALLNVFVVIAIVFGSGIGSFVLIDNLRILGLWLRNFDRSLFQQMALAFSLTTPFFSYQIPMNLMFRSGELAAVAQRHYAFILSSLLFAGIALFGRSVALYLSLLVTAEILLSVTFFAPGKAQTTLVGSRSGLTAIRLAALTFIMMILLWLTARHNVGGCFVGNSLQQILASIFLFAGVMLTVAGVCYWTHQPELRLLRRPSEILTQ